MNLVQPKLRLPIDLTHWGGRPLRGGGAPGPSQTVALKDGELWASSDRPGSVRIGCTQGEVWITQSFDARDTILHAGESFLSLPNGKLIVQALAPAMIRIEPSR